MFIYFENGGGKFDNPGKIWDMDGTLMYMKHFENLMILEAMSRSPKNFAESRQVEKEIQICHRKLAFWEKHPNTDGKILVVEKDKMKRLWAKSQGAVK